MTDGGPLRRGGHLLLSGFMGTGKTTVGRHLGALLGRPFVDLDLEIEARAGASIAQIFAAEGEAGFRVRESAALRVVLEGGAAVVALGGGTLVDPDNRRLARTHGTVVTLTAQAEVLHARLDGDTARPLLRAVPIASLLAQRAEAYADADVLIATDALSPPGVAELILQRLEAA